VRAFEVIGTGLLMISITTVIHAVFMVIMTHALEWRLARFGPAGRHIDRAAIISLVTLWMFLAIIIEAWIWALVYLNDPLITVLSDLETAVYFSMVTFTTLGYGDVVLTGKGRALATIQAANGVIIFGWTTALIFYFIQKVYKKD
jgi:hypothetical protein